MIYNLKKINTEQFLNIETFDVGTEKMAIKQRFGEDHPDYNTFI